MRSVFLLIVLFSFVTIRAQESNRIIIKSLDGRVLNTVDSLSFKDNLQSSLYYVDFISQQAYTGKALVYYGIKAIDSISVENGYHDGWKKTYFREVDSLKLGEVEYKNQNQLMSISYPVNSTLKNKSAFGSYYSEEGRYFIEVIYKHSGKIIVKQSLKGSVSKTIKGRLKFSNLSELELFFRKHYRIYSYCKQAGFFGKTEIE